VRHTRLKASIYGEAQLSSFLLYAPDYTIVSDHQEFITSHIFSIISSHGLFTQIEPKAPPSPK
jgi:hypothetical protein